MTDANGPGSPLEAVAGRAGSRATEAFSVLGNETRLSILLALWEAFEPFTAENAVPFSELRERVGMRDSGQFNYHLDRLEGQFVRRTDAGYELQRTGHRLVRTVIAGAGLEEPAFERAEIDVDCSRCGAPTALTYRDEWLYIVCTECAGFFGEHESRPEGMLSGAALNPTGLADRAPEAAWNTAWTAGLRDIQSAVEGICDACSGTVARSLDVCAEHADGGVCGTCGRHLAVMARLRCHTCKNHHTVAPRTLVSLHPAVVSFYYERGVALQYEVDDLETARESAELVGDHEQRLVAEDPPLVRVTVAHDGDELAVTLDDSLAVVDVDDPG